MNRLRGILILLALAPTLVMGQEGSDTSSESNGLVQAFANGQVKALLRWNLMYRDSSLQLLQDGSDPAGTDEKVQSYSALGGYVGYETAPWFNLSAGGTVYTSQPFGKNPDDRRGLGGLYEADGGQDPYTVMGELFMRWQIDGHRLTVGRQEMPAYRMVSLSNIRMTPITHQGAAYDFTAVDGLKFSAAYISKMKERNAKDFIDMVRGARLTDFQDGKQIIRGDYNPDYFENGTYVGPAKEMLMAGLVWTTDSYTVEAWNYYIRDFLNSLYLYGDYRFTTANEVNWTISGQYTLQKDMGEAVGGNIDTWHYGLRVAASKGPALGFLGYNEVSYNEQSYDGGTLFVRWGTPQMFNSFQVQDSELAGTKSLGAGFQYDFGWNGHIRGVVMRWRYGIYDMPDDLYMTDARQDRAEATFDLRYALGKDSHFGIFTQMDGFSLQFRLAWNNYDTSYDFEAYREIHGYEFESVTKDFWDARLYLDYVF